ncbi:MAG: hypothetical protein ACRBBM_09625 [Pseudomonadaceae bacterium]
MDDLEMALRIKAERKQYEEVDEVIHNRDLHSQILSTWRRDSPKMVKELEALNILDDMAFVCQERMWRAEEAFSKGGMYFTDAREQAERENLMLEPEEDLERDDSDLPLELQGLSEHEAEKARAELERLGLLPPRKKSGWEEMADAIVAGQQAIAKAGL